MNYRELGKTGLRVAEIGYGTWQIANDPNMWVGADPEVSLQCLERYVELGGNFIDTAWIYGYDEAQPDRHPSEELIGKFLRQTGQRDKVLLASKVPPKNFKWPARQGIPITEVFPSDHIIQCVDDSLRSLGVETIDLMQFHVWQDAFVDDDGWKETIQKVTQAGKVKFWGISVNDYQPSNCLRALDTGLISTVQFIFNLFHQKPLVKLLPYARSHNIGLIARVPLDEGGLSGNFTVDTKFDDGDLRAKFFQGDRLLQLVQHTDALKTLLGSEAASLPELDLRFILSNDAVSTVIPGMRKRKHVELNTSVSDGRKLSSALMAELSTHAWERNFYPDVDQALASTGFLVP